MTNDEKLLKTYIGKNYEKIIEKKFSLPAFFLGEIYFVYRKMYLKGFLYFLISISLIGIAYSIFALILFIAFLSVLGDSSSSQELFNMSLLPLFIAGIIFLLARLWCGKSTNSSYVKFSKRKIEKIIKENPNASDKEIEDICKKNGGTIDFIEMAIIFGIVISIILLLFLSIY